MADFEFTITKSDSMVKLEEYIDYLIMERCNEIYYKVISQNSEYQNLQAQIEECFQKLLQVLSEPVSKEIIAETLPSMIGILEMSLPRLIYKPILKDGLELKKWLGNEWQG